MSEWWERAYPGGPMVGPAWPRALYSPDAAPSHTPSGDGPDVVACKRAISRGGRWPWGTFDDTFSNGFSHGKTGGNVKDSGVAGFQRQMKVQPTGWIGEATANAIRSARIPEGLPNAGQPLMDDTCVDLIEKAAKQFKEGSGKKVRAEALKKAQSKIGTKESPYGSNQCFATDWYNMVGPWCAMFCTWAYETGAQGIGKDSPSFVKGSYYAYVPYVVSDAQNKRRGLSVTNDPQPGDLVAYNWDGGEYDHIGIFESGNTSSWVNVEGNTSTSSNSNGGEVMRRSRSRSQMQAVTFVRVAEP